jgi:DNA-binding CsgD family transcriptional regulator
MEARRGRPPYPDPVTPAEARVLELVREGRSNAEIAVRLGVSVNTVRYHVSNLLAKANASERAELRQWQPALPAGRSARWGSNPRPLRWLRFRSRR